MNARLCESHGYVETQQRRYARCRRNHEWATRGESHSGVPQVECIEEIALQAVVASGDYNF